MGIILLLVLSSAVVGAVFLVAFLISVGGGQYDDLHTPAVRILFNDRIQPDNSNGP